MSEDDERDEAATAWAASRFPGLDPKDDDSVLRARLRVAFRAGWDASREKAPADG